MTIAIEPMINMGTNQVKQLSDGWTIVTKDAKPSAHFEHNIAIVRRQARIAFYVCLHLQKSLGIQNDEEKEFEKMGGSLNPQSAKVFPFSKFYTTTMLIH